MWKRDAGQCAFVGPEGRCTERGFLEFHHVEPHAVGGSPAVDNLELRCRAHNVHEAEPSFGSRWPLLAREAGPVSAADVTAGAFRAVFEHRGADETPNLHDF